MTEKQWAFLWLVIVGLLLQSLYLTQRVERLEREIGGRKMTQCDFMTNSTDKNQGKFTGIRVLHDNVNNPQHYLGRHGMESIDVLRNFMTLEQLQGFHLGNALKYQLRYQKKNGLEDLKKARKNLDWLIEEMEKEE